VRDVFRNNKNDLLAGETASYTSLLASRSFPIRYSESVLATNGDKSARVFEVRAYRE